MKSYEKLYLTWVFFTCYNFPTKGDDDKMHEQEKLYTIHDIAKMTSLTTRTIRNYLKKETLIGTKVGGQWRFTANDIKSFMNNNLMEATKNENENSVIGFLDGDYPDLDNDNSCFICSIITIKCSSMNEGNDYKSKILNAISKSDFCNKFKFNFKFNVKNKVCTITVFSTPPVFESNSEKVKNFISI